MSINKDKFERIKREHPKINLEPYGKVYETLEKISNSKKGITISVLSEKTKFKRSKVERIIRILKKYNYVRVAEGSNGIPYLCVIDKKSERDWKWGKDQIGSNINKNYESLLENLDKTKNVDNQLKTEIKSYQNKKKNGKFFKVYNTLIENIWSNIKESDLNKMEMGSTAIRYCVGIK